MTRRTAKLAATCALLVLGVLGFGASAASANSYEVRSCDKIWQGRDPFGMAWLTGRYDAQGAMPVNDCPNGITLDQDGPVEQGVAGVAWFEPYSTSTIRSAQFDYFGGDTSGAYTYTVRSCADRACDTIATLAPGSAANAPARAMLDLAAPDQASIAIWIECVQAICPDPPPLVVNDFDLEYNDDQSPTLSDLTTTPDIVDGPDASHWLRGGVMQLSFQAHDSGSGVEQAYAGIDGAFGDDLAVGTCEQQNGASPCQHDVELATTLDLTGLSDGDHFVRVVVLDDAATFPCVVDVPFHVDTKPPNEPTGLLAAPGVSQWGWTASPVITLAHDDPSGSDGDGSGSGWASAVFDLRNDPNAEPVESIERDDPSAGAELTFPGEGAWDVGVAYRDLAGNTGNRAHRFVGYDKDTPDPPGVDALGWVRLGALYAGLDQTWSPPAVDPDLESGICGYSFSVDDEAFGIPAETANVPAQSTSAPVPASLGEGEHFAHVRSVACNGKASETATEPVRVDGTAPVATLHGISGDGWITSPPNISLSASDAGSGMGALEFGFAGDGSLGMIPGSVAALSVPQGESTLSYAAIDAVGNESEIKHRTIRADWTGPSVEFAAGELDHPNAIAAHVEDDESGIDSAVMQIRRTDAGASVPETAWRTLGDAAAVAPSGRRSLDIRRSVPDESFEPGTYAVRVLARDVAGNWSDAAPTKSLSLPLRAATALTAAIATVGKHAHVNRSGASQDRVVRYGSKAALVGTLTDARGNAVPHATISLAATPEFGVEESFGETTTDAAGEYAVPIPEGGTRRFRVEFAGADELQPATQTATVRVRAALEIKISPRRVRSGRPFTISGRLLSGSLGTPEGGKVVTIQYLLRDRWQVALATPRVDAHGRFKYRVRHGLSTARATTLYFHVKAIREGTWPFLTGSSKPAKLRLLP